RLGEAPLATAVAGILFFEEPVHGPLKALEEFLGKEQTNFVRIGNFGRAVLFLFFLSSSWRRRNFFVSNRADTEFVFGEDCRIERDLVPIGQSPACFQTHRLRAAATIKSLELCFGRYVKTIRQTHFDLLSKKMIGRPVPEALAFVKLTEEKGPWWENVCIHRVGEAAAGKSRWRTVSAGHFLGGDGDFLLDLRLSWRLPEDRIMNGRKD